MQRARGLVVASGMFWLLAGSARAEDPPVAAPDPVAAKLAAMQAELDQLRADQAAAAPPVPVEAVKEPTFRLGGFIDMGLQKLWTNDPALADSRNATFVLGNVNLYFDFHPTDDWSSLVEVRLTNYPDGSTIGGVRIDTSVNDPGNSLGDDKVRWGTIVLERAYLQWQHAERLGVRVGQFLTPYGIWNVDHGTPTLIALSRPEFVSIELWPAHQLGVEAFGTLRDVLPGRWALEYHAYVSNGRTPGVVDTDEDKMVGGRVIASTTRPYRMAFGVSAMRGSFDDNTPLLGAASALAATAGGVAYTERGIGVDASLDIGAVRVRSEAILRRVAYSETDLSAAGVAAYGEQVDALQGDAYLLAAYRIANTKLEPYVYAEGLRAPSENGDLQLTGSLGLNYYFTPAIQLKTQFSHTRFADTGGPVFRAGQITEDFLAAKLVMGL